MNLDELQSVQSRERQASKLQHLRASFYEEAGEFIGGLRAERNELAAASDNPFDDPEIAQVSDKIKTAERTVESIYERRVGKVVKLASIAAAGMPYDEEGLTVEEERLFDGLVESIERNRECVLSVLDGETPALDCTQSEGSAGSEGPEATTERGPSVDENPGRNTPGSPQGTADDGRGDALERSGSAGTGPTAAGHSGGEQGAEASGSEEQPTPPDRPIEENTGPAPGGDSTPVETIGDGTADPTGGTADGEPLDIAGAMGASDEQGVGTGSDPTTASEPAAREAATTPDEARPDVESGAVGRGGTEEDEHVERTTVRVTADVGEVFGVDGRAYDLSAEDVVTLPTPNADGLVSKDAAERLE